MDVEVNGTRLHVSGQASGHPILFLHGMGCDGTDWEPQFDAFGDRFRVVAIDHRGHGRSDRDVGEGYSIAGFAADALRVMDLLDIDMAHVVGLSMGGMIAQQLAITAPERVCSLSLMDTFSKARDNGISMFADQVETAGLEALSGGFQSMVFSAATRKGRPDLLERFEAQFKANTPACLAWAMQATSQTSRTPTSSTRFSPSSSNNPATMEVTNERSARRKDCAGHRCSTRSR